MKHLKTFAALCCVVAAFAACEPQNGPANGQNGNNGTANGHEYVDLGLPSGLNWATCNVGATKPEEYGNYYAWGETQPRDDDDGTYTYGDYGIVDNKTVLDPEDDAAAVNWGGAWRMPTKEEWQELIHNCTWTSVENYKETGVNGCEVKGWNGNSIFLPSAGYRSDGYLLFEGYYGHYWSSSLDTKDMWGTQYYDAWGGVFDPLGVGMKHADRIRCWSVRPVCE